MPRFDSLQDWLRWQEQLHPRPIDLGLARIAEVYRQLNPGHPKPPTITVAGTNGKGSCVALLEAIYRAQGYKVGAYTSPHILRYNERIRIDGLPVADDLICQSFARIDALRGDTSLSYFEFGTLAALDIFSRADVGVQLLEVGLGGRLDAVNIVEPDVALVTTIALDHVEWLGDTVDAIAREKAGIFREDVPAVIGDYRPPESLLEAAEETQALLMQIGSAFDYEKQHAGWCWSAAGRGLADLPVPPFKGEHQYRNASAVIMAVMAMQQRLPVADTAIRQGLQQAQIQGRFQLFEGVVPVLLDVGHNPQAVQTLVDYLGAYFSGAKIHAVFAMMKDKDIHGVLRLMRPHVAQWYLAPLENQRAASEAMLLDCFNELQIDQIHHGFVSAQQAITVARQQALPGELVLVFGSFFLVSEYLSNKS